MRAVIVHLLQSTAFAIFAAALAATMRSNSAHLKYRIWFAASMKFLIPFAPLVVLGSLVKWRPAVAAVAKAMPMYPAEQIDGVFRRSFTIPQARPETSLPIGAMFAALWLCGFLAVSARWVIQWRRVRKMARAGRPVDIGAEVPAISCAAAIEPGIFGIFRPVLLLPDGIAERLSAAELSAVIAHEMAHVRRRDNLLAAMHMAVEAVFWFYPLVWWIGSRLVEERERACDEDVVRAGSERRVYAESILRTCEFYLASPVECVAGVTGADLKARVVRIVSGCVPRRLSYTKRALLAAAAAMAIGVPVAVGLAQTQDENSGKRESFEVASIKPGDPSDRRIMVGLHPGGRFRGVNVPLTMLIRQAYEVQDFQIEGTPEWAKTERWNIEAKMSGPGSGNTENDPRSMTSGQMQIFEKRVDACMRSLLEDRFGMKLHRESKEMPIYALVVTKGGSKLTEAAESGPRAQKGMRMGRGELMAMAAPVAFLANSLSERVGRPVEDRTGLKGFYDFNLNWTPEPGETMGIPGVPDNAVPPSADQTGPSLFTAVQEQLGLKLKSSKGPVEILAIDHIEKPSAN